MNRPVPDEVAIEQRVRSAQMQALETPANRSRRRKQSLASAAPFAVLLISMIAEFVYAAHLVGERRAIDYYANGSSELEWKVDVFGVRGNVCFLAGGDEPGSKVPILWVEDANLMKWLNGLKPSEHAEFYLRFKVNFTRGFATSMQFLELKREAGGKTDVYTPKQPGHWRFEKTHPI
jgi:hypothetical protein